MSFPTHAQVLDACSTLLESYGARPVPPADPDWSFLRPVGCPLVRCGCGHPVIEHGATGECWNVDAGICPCDRTKEQAA